MSEFTSQFNIGDPVNVANLDGNIRAVTFTTGKVRYAVSVILKDGQTSTFHNLDSILVTPREGERVEYKFDNYS